MNTTQMLIGGERVAATGGARLERRNPLTETGASTAPAATPDDAIAAVHAAQGVGP